MPVLQDVLCSMRQKPLIIALSMLAHCNWLPKCNDHRRQAMEHCHRKRSGSTHEAWRCGMDVKGVASKASGGGLRHAAGPVLAPDCGRCPYGRVLWPQVTEAPEDTAQSYFSK